MDYYSTKFLKDNDLGEGLKKILHQYYEVIKIMKKELIKFIDISKSYGNHLVLDEFNLSVKENEFVTLLGPSGCGKTTTLRLLGGFETPDSGKILFDGKDITNLPANQRKLNTVFQKYSLFPHMTIEENIAFGLKISKKSTQYINDKIKYALKLVNLDGYENRSVDSLSGGQQQRIAIARAIVNEPKILLLDEPLGALDLKLRQSMQYELIRLKNELGITFIYVTHDQEEALTMSDQIVVMNQGYIQQIGTPEDIYNEPENAFVADFIGSSNIMDGIMIKDKLVSIFGIEIHCVDEGFGTNTPVDVVIRPEDLVITSPEHGFITGKIISTIFKGVHYEIEVLAKDYKWLIHTTKFANVGDIVGLSIDPFDIQIMKKAEYSDEKAVEIDEEL
jgi:spermidine/putrescine transport system ATP-binding protein